MLRYSKDGRVWQIEREGASIKTTLDGVEAVEQLPSEAIAAKRFDILIGKQARDGWKRVKDEVKAAPAKKPPAAIVEDARNPELEAAFTAMLRAGGDDAELYRLYADWLEQQGDPRGRLIALQLLLEAKRLDTKLQLMTDAYLERIRPYIFRGVVNAVGREAELHRGFIRSLSYKEGDLAAMIEDALGSPATRFVTELLLDDEGGGWLPRALEIVGRAAPATLLSLQIGGTVQLAHLDALAPVLPRLHRFALFSVHDRRLTAERRVFEQIATARWTELEDLHLDLPQGMRIEVLRTLFERPDLKLTRIGFATDRSAEVLAMLADTPLAARIEALQLDHADCPDVFRSVRSRFPRLREVLAPWPFLEAIHERPMRLEPPARILRYPDLSNYTYRDDDERYDEIEE